jgi:DNA-binding winged helix-turn-helix (wHTH) protein/tetratricopeptide (TPR) repeat protein
VKSRFGSFVLDPEAGRLQGPRGEVHLRPQAFRMLEVLVEQAPKILSQEELLDRVWGVEHLSPTSVKQAVSEVRQALGDDPARPSVIETVHRRGYRCIATVEKIEELPLAEQPAPVSVQEKTAPSLRVQGWTRWFHPLRRTAAVVPVLAGLSALALVQDPLPASRPLPARVMARPANSRPAVAILGFKNLSGDPDSDWIGGALAEVVGFELMAPGHLRVVAAEEVARMSRELALRAADSLSSEKLDAVGRNLGADLVIAGSYLLAAVGKEPLRVQLLVQDTRTGETVAWARQTGAPEELTDLAAAAARGIQGTLGGNAGPGPSPEAVAFASSHESLRLYSEALSKLRVADAPAALPLLERAVALDPKNPFLQDALARAYDRLGFEARAREAAQQALTLSAGLPREVRLGMEGRLREVRGEWSQAAAIYAGLQRLHPDDLEVGLHLTAVQGAAGHADLALSTVAKLRQLPAPERDDPRLDLAEYEVSWALGDFGRCRDLAAQAIAKAERRGAPLLVARGRFARGWALHRLGKEEGALTDFRLAQALYERTGDRGGAAGALVASASVLQVIGRPTAARRAYETALPVLREIGDRAREAKVLNNFAALLGDQGELSGVTALLERSLAIKREIGDLQGVALTLANLGNVLRARGELGRAHARLEEALEIQRERKDSYGVAFTLRGLARVLVHEGKTGEALAALEEALALSHRSGDPEGAAEALLALGDLSRQSARPDHAREWYQQAFEAFEHLHQASSMVYPLLNLAELDSEQKQFAAARSRFEQALALALKAQNELLEAHARAGLASAFEKLGDLRRARSENEKALALWIKLGEDDKAKDAKQKLAHLKGPAATGV